MSQKYKVYINNTPKIIEENWKDFCSKFIMIEAAGGLVFNKEEQILMIFRNGKWDLPKGKLEEGENKKQCAIREVEEECSIVGLDITEKIIETYHTYSLKGEEILKRTYWYKMRTDFDGELSPQIEEGITKVSWIDKDKISEKLTNSYGNILDVLKTTI
jgi:8-oxo-dGTP pyrophosphatase MutT (NUDIX family)